MSSGSFGNHLQNFAGNCSCVATFKSQLWSKEKLSWNLKAGELKFPNYFSMITGCAVTISKYNVIFIGGHHTIHNDFQDDLTFVPISKPINNQVIEYNFEINAWNNLPDISFLHVSKKLYKINSWFENRHVIFKHVSK